MASQLETSGIESTNPVYADVMLIARDAWSRLGSLVRRSTELDPAEVQMPYDIDTKLVVAVASSALFDLDEADQIYQEEGTDAYREYQRQHEKVVLNQGPAFPLVRRLLSIEGRSPSDHPVEVVLLSRNDPDTGLRVFHSIDHYGLRISRGAFVSGRNPFPYMNAFNACLFLSANGEDVRRAVKRGLPAGQVFPTDFSDDHSQLELRVAFDFDGVLVDDSAEAVFQAEGLTAFHVSERQHSSEPLPAGPLKRFFIEIGRIQNYERERERTDSTYEPQIRTAVVTARDAPAHERLIRTLRSWGILVDEGFFLGGIEKTRVLEEFRPHIFFDDQIRHIELAAHATPSAHIPYGVANRASTEEVEAAFAENVKRNGQDRGERTRPSGSERKDAGRQAGTGA